MVELGSRCKRFLIMAIPHEIFKNIDHCHLSMNIWAELEKQIEGGRRLSRDRAICIDEYHNFKAKEGESLSDTYSRFNTLISNCKRYGSLGSEWMNLTIDVDSGRPLWISEESRTTSSSDEEKFWRTSDIGHRGWSRKGGEPKKEEKEKKKKKKVLIAESDESSEDEVKMKEMIKTLALITREYKKGGERRDYRSFDKRNYREGGRREGSKRREKELKTPQKVDEQNKEETQHGCFKCGKPGHFAAECWSKGPKGPRDETYYKKKADYCQQRSLLAQNSELGIDESFEEDAQRTLLSLEEDSDIDDEIFCGIARIDSNPSDSSVPELNIDPDKWYQSLETQISEIIMEGMESMIVSKVPMLKPNEFDMWKIRIKKHILLTDYSMWDIIENVPLKRKLEKMELFPHLRTYAERKTRQYEMKVLSTLLLAIPNEYQHQFINCENAKVLWQALEKTFAGSKSTKNETMTQTFDRFNKLIGQLAIVGVKMDNDDINKKFLRSFGEEWIIVFEAEVEAKRKPIGYSHNTALLSSGDSTVNGESTTGAGVSKQESGSDLVMEAVFSSHIGVPLVNEDFDQINADDLEEMDLKWKWL
ncbi:hypothetical protein OSB04_un001869 [Centaurea solstitialis]|uniref:CCHC-type domain-containing protein n=1 Tax=Centaurea solstitialis TaxID=347529 RepID=A0AA38SN15_9ASTR|nr:hypothetical protein OSB04_un001869 [Centaurea solstitialis]